MHRRNKKTFFRLPLPKRDVRDRAEIMFVNFADHLWRLTVALFTLSALISGCDSDKQSTASEGPPFDCPDNPTVYIMATPDNYAALTTLLDAATISHAPLPIEVSPADLRGAIIFGSDIAGTDAYDTYMKTYKYALYDFVYKANLLVQLGQSPELERHPPFLPVPLDATNAATENGPISVTAPTHPLMANIETDGVYLRWSTPIGALHGFSDNEGFAVLLTETGDALSPVMMEGRWGYGRILLTSLPLDSVVEENGLQYNLTVQLLSNLRQYTTAVCRQSPTVPEITVSGPATPVDDEVFTLVVLPDTQYYAAHYPGLLDLQTGWTAYNAATLRTAFVLHLGDVTNTNRSPEWERVRGSMSLLEGIVPYGIAPGNHDYGPAGDASTRESLLNTYFPFDEAAARATWGGAFEANRLDNTYHLFEAGGKSWIILFLEWAPRPETVTWANAVMSSYPDRYGILVTHAYLYNDNLRLDHTDPRPQGRAPCTYNTPGGISDGEDLWQYLVRHHRFVMTFSGHVNGDGTGYLESTTVLGNTCHQMLSNYQMRDLGGEGYLRILEINSNGRVRVRSYSPFYDRYLDTSDQQFQFYL